LSQNIKELLFDDAKLRGIFQIKKHAENRHILCRKKGVMQKKCRKKESLSTDKLSASIRRIMLFTSIFY